MPAWGAPGRLARLVGGLLLLMLLAYGATQLLGRPLLGMADNGDFWRVTGPAGLENPRGVGTPTHRFVQPFYRRVPPDDRVGHSSTSLIARWAMSLPGGRPGTFHVRRMGALLLGLTCILFAVAALRSGGAALPTCVAFAWVLMDPAYLLFFNSFYADAVALLGILGCATLLCVRGAAPSRMTLGLLLLSAATVAWSKQAHVALALALAATLLAIGGTRRSPGNWIAAALSVLVTVGAAFYFTRGPGPSFPQINNYNAVFAGIGPVSRDPERSLRTLDISPEWLDRVGTHYFQQPVPHELARELESLSRPRLASLYATDPGALATVLGRAQQNLSSPRRVLGNYSYWRERPYRRIHRVPWSFGRLREALLRHPAVFWSWWFIVGAATAFFARRRKGTTGPWAAATFLWLTVGLETATAILGDGLFALGGHLRVARFANDLLLALVLALAVEHGLRRLRGYRHSFTRRDSPESR